MADYTTIDDPTEYFQVKIWTGNATSRTIDLDNNATMQPDFSWVKSRSNAYEQYWENSSRGTDKYLRSNRTSAQDNGTVVTYNSTGFGIGSGAENNEDSTTNVGYFWKGNGGTTASNSDGSITSTVQANTDAGFSIVEWTGNSTNSTVGHGLGAAPTLIFSKKTTGTSAWNVYHGSLTSAAYLLEFNTNAEASVAAIWNSTAPTSSVFSIGTDAQSNQNTQTFLAWCFVEKQGYSKFGKYVGNGDADGPFVYTGFKPAFVIIKPASNSGYNWAMTDHKRNPSNEVDKYLWADDIGAEYNGASVSLDIDYLSNGFKLRTTRSETNQSAATNVYMAWAENPFVTSTDTNSIPATAR
jgi:hypothetical protein